MIPNNFVPPEGYEYVNAEVMSNCDHSIDEDVARQLRDRPIVARYSGWNFFGYVWCDHQRQVYVCEVWQYKEPVETLEASTLEELQRAVSDKYGYE